MNKINYPIVRFEQRIIKPYFGEERLSVLTLFVIDRNGRIMEKIVGFSPEALGISLTAVFK